MRSWALLLMVLFVITFRSTLGYKDVLKEHITQQSAEPLSSPACPQGCSCNKNDTHHIISVDCSSRGLIIVPDLPQTVVELSLRNNSISSIDCASFKFLHSLERVDLAFNDISNLPPCVFQSQMDSLLNLNISMNNLTYLYVNLFHGLAYLEFLDVSFNLISTLDSKTFADLGRLKVLNLSFNKIVTVAQDAFNGLYSLQTLDLQNNFLDDDTSFHRDVFQDLGALETLNTKANSGRLDSAIAPSLRNLSHLYIVRNSDHGVLGAEFRQLINLQVLHLSDLYYTSFYARRYKNHSISVLFSVRSNYFNNIQTVRDFELYMSSCSIPWIEVGTFLSLPTLVTLDVSNNPLIGSSKSLKDQLWVEDLSKTKISYLDLSNTWLRGYGRGYSDEDFEGLAKTNLKTLILKHNDVSGLSPDMRNFPTTIEKLDLSYNCLSFYSLYSTFISSDLPNFKLRELYVDSCSLIFKYPGILSDIDGLLNEILNSAFNHDSKRSHTNTSDLNGVTKRPIPPKPYCPLDWFGFHSNVSYNITIICLPSDLEVISAYSALDNHWDSFASHISSSIPHIRILNNTVLRRIDLSDNRLKVWSGPIENVPSLKFLDLSRNQCNNLSVNFFQHMVSLETLILNENQLAGSLSDDLDGLTFSTLANLRTLDISQNNIKDINSQVFIHNTNLEKLDLSNNQLSGFQPTISTFLNMSFLDLSVNLLPGLSQQTSDELKQLKSRNTDFTVNLLDNRLLVTCDYLPFLELVLSKPDIFFKVDQIKFHYPNKTSFYYKDLVRHYPVLARECLAQRFFILILIIFFVCVGTVTICAVIYHKRWKLRYLYYIGQRRMHIGEHVVDYTPDAAVFVTYDQDDIQWRRFMQRIFLPGLKQRDITYILGEVDFPGGDVMAHVTGAVVGSRKTVVLLSEEIFDDHHREFEMNLSIMREMDTRSLKIIPIFVEEVDLSLYPREIEVFLRNQWERCLTYSDTDEFWDSFVNAVREDD